MNFSCTFDGLRDAERSLPSWDVFVLSSDGSSDKVVNSFSSFLSGPSLLGDGIR